MASLVSQTPRDVSRRRRVTVVAVIVCLPLVVGCGDSGDSGATSSGAPSNASGQAQGGTVEDQLGFTRNGIAAAQAKVENTTATCMKAEGFEYVPGDPVAVQTALTGKPAMSDEEFERTFGYGITTLYGRGSAQSDPNAKIRAKLGPADRRAYDRALSGGNPEQTFALAVDTGDFTKLGGCTKKATDEAFGGTRLLTTLQRELDDLDDSILADQRMVKAGEAWTKCMRDATGEEYEDSEAIEDEIHQRFERIVGEALPPGQVAPEGSYDARALAALQREEVELSRTDIVCERKFIAPVEDGVRAQKERRFREEKADLLRQVKPLGS